MVAACPGQDTNSVIALLGRAMFSQLKVLISDNGPTFLSKKLQQWADSRCVTLRRCPPFPLQANKMVEKVICDIKTLISIYPTFKGGWKCCLEAAVAHQNRTHTASFGCSPHFSAHGEVPMLPAKKTWNRRQTGIVWTTQNQRRTKQVPKGDEDPIREATPRTQAKYCPKRSGDCAEGSVEYEHTNSWAFQSHQDTDTARCAQDHRLL